MQREVVWQAVEEPALEHVVISEHGDGGHSVNSTVTGLLEGEPFTVRYAIECDTNWWVRSLDAEVPQGWAKIDLRSDGGGNWRTGDPNLEEMLSGCIDVDIIVTPFTNTLPIRRLRLAVGEAAEINVVYVLVPSLALSNRKQRYTRLDARQYRFESIESGQVPFTADLGVDDDGLVTDYPRLFRRLYPASDD